MSADGIKFDEFCTQIKRKTHEKLSEDLSRCLVMKKVQKRNGIIKTGLSFEGKNIMFSPIVYLDDYFNKSEMNDIDSISSTVVNTLTVAMNGRKVNEVEALLNQNSMCNQITYRLINKSMNMEYLKDKMYRDFLDLALVYEISVPFANGTGTIIITHDLAKRFNFSEEELFNIAKRNTPRDRQIVILEFKDIIGNIFECEEGNLVDDNILYVLTSKNKVFGATVIAYPEVGKKIYEKYGKVYLLPSSLHEMIIVDHGFDVTTLKNMVKEVNATIVDLEDVLSDSVYEVTENGIHIV